MKKAFVQLALLAILIGALISTTPIHGESVDSIIGDDDTYVKTGSVGDVVHFNWTFSKDADTNYVVIIEVNGFDPWEAQVSPNYFFLDEDTPRRIVGLTVSVPLYPDETEKTGNISVMFRSLNNSEKTMITKNATICLEKIMLDQGENTILGFFENPLPGPASTPIGTFFLNVFLWILIAFGSYYFIKIFLINLAKKTKTNFDDRLIEIVRRPFLGIIIIYGALQSILKLHFTIGFQVYIFRLSVFIFFILIVYIIYKVYNEVLDAWPKKKGSKDRMFEGVIKPILKKVGIIIILVGGFIFALNASGIEITALLAGAGIMGLVIAFAAQDTLSNFFSGIHLLLDRPFKIGDVIYMEPGNYWQVVNVGMRSTRLLSIFDNELVILPNNEVANKKIINIVRPDAKIKKRIKVSVAYGTDLEKVCDMLLEIAKKHPNVLKDKESEPIVRISEFGDSGIDILLIMWIDEVMNQWKVLSDIRLQIDIRFKKENITIPFPQRTLWIKDTDNVLNKTRNKTKDADK